MRHILLLLALGIGGYFVWQAIGNAARVHTRLFLGQHLFKVAAIVVAVFAFFISQALYGSAKLF
jgi:hypothetical protein